MIRWLYHRVIRPILTAHDSPEAVAGGVAWGLAIALTPTLGVQMPIALLVATLFGCNRVVAVSMVWLSNPLTALPLYYGEYVVGLRLLGQDGLAFQDFSERWSRMSGRNGASMRFCRSFSMSMSAKKGCIRISSMSWFWPRRLLRSLISI